MPIKQTQGKRMCKIKLICIQKKICTCLSFEFQGHKTL